MNRFIIKIGIFTLIFGVVFGFEIAYINFEWYPEMDNDCVGRKCAQWETCIGVEGRNLFMCNHRGINPNYIGADVRALGEGACTSLGFCGATSRMVCPECKTCEVCPQCSRVRNCTKPTDPESITTTTIPTTTTTQIVTTTVVNITVESEMLVAQGASLPLNNTKICEPIVMDCPADIEFLKAKLVLWALLIISWIFIFVLIHYINRHKKSYDVEQKEPKSRWEMPEFLDSPRVKNLKKAVRTGIRSPWNAFGPGPSVAKASTSKPVSKTAGRLATIPEKFECPACEIEEGNGQKKEDFDIFEKVYLGSDSEDEKQVGSPAKVSVTAEAEVHTSKGVKVTDV